MLVRHEAMREFGTKWLNALEDFYSARVIGVRTAYESCRQWLQCRSAAYLERARGNDGELRQRVEALLEGHDHVGGFFGTFESVGLEL